MHTTADRLNLCLPVLLALLLVLFAAMPLKAPLILAPNAAWVLGVLVGGICPPAWPLVAAFTLGLAQDALDVTPLGAQALLAVLLALAARQHAYTKQPLLFRVRWLEAAGALAFAQAGLWLLQRGINGAAPAVALQGQAIAVNALWYGLFYGLLRPLLARLPGASL